jgi:hypothetical protein
LEEVAPRRLAVVSAVLAVARLASAVVLAPPAAFSVHRINQLSAAAQPEVFSAAALAQVPHRQDLEAHQVEVSSAVARPPASEPSKPTTAPEPSRSILTAKRILARQR